MTSNELLTSLRERGVHLWLEGERVRYRAAADVLTPAVLAELRQRKAEIAEQLRQAEVAPEATDRRDAEDGGREGRPLSYSQERLWFLDKMEPNSPAYNIHVTMRLDGSLNAAALQRTFGEILRRHEALRTRFDMVDGRPVLQTDPAGIADLAPVDLTGYPPDQREGEAMRRAAQDVRQPFDLARDILLRTRLYRLGPAQHVLVLVMHHAAADGWSLDVLFREMTALYNCFRSDQPSPLPELPIQYGEFAAWQRDHLRGALLQRQIDYWRRRLAQAPALLDLPTDHPRPAVQTMHGTTLVESFPPALASAVQELGRRASVSPFMTLLAAFAVLLHRYSRQDDILVGTPMACRNRTELEGLIGLFVNTVVMRVDLGGNPSFYTLLAQVRDTTVEALAHQELPIEKLVEELQPERSLARSPLFQVMFVANSHPRAPTGLAELTVTPLSLTTETSKFDLTLYWDMDGGALRIHVEYNTDLFETATIQRLFGHYQTLLEGIVARPEQPIEMLPLLTAAERQQVLVDWNSTGQEYPRDTGLHELVEAQVARTPEAVAVECGSDRLTYCELNHRANRLAEHLRGLGVAPGTLAGICIERSLDMVVGLLGILKAGGAYLPLDPHFPAERLAFMIEDAQPVVLLTQRPLAGTLPAHRCPVVCLDALPPPPPSPPRVPVARATGADLAYVLYTSGSTGRPKGVQIAHRSVVNFLRSMQREPGLTATDVWVAVTTLSFDIAGLELYLPLVTGARVVIASRETAADGRLLARLLADAHATVLQATPVTWQMLLAADWKGQPGLKILCGGEALSANLAGQLTRCSPSVWNLYGPTETTIWSAVSRVVPDRPVSVGRPIANTEFYLLDPQGQPVPIGVPGELWIGGDGVAIGYLNRPELTAERFPPHPFRNEPGARLYRTGDLMRYRGDGTLEYLGRLDHQVKIRGYRIELGEIEKALNQHPQIQQAVVETREAAAGDRRLAAYVQLKNGAAVGDGDLRAFLRERLPDYMLPAAFVRLAVFPLTPNGKVDRKALPAPDNIPTDSRAAFLAPRDGLEQQLSRLWEEVFHRSPIGVRDNFFDLGGHSLLAVRLFARVEKLTGKNLPLVTLFQAPTIEQLAGVLRQQGWEPPWSPLVPIKANGTRPPFYCVHGVGGNILEYLDLANYIDGDQPFYGIQAAGLDGKRTGPKAVSEMATLYIREIQALQPTGPYYLGGSSYGGVIAYEMAQQLHQAGETVALLAFFDTAGPGYPEYLPTTSRLQKRFNHFRYRVSLHWGNFQAANARQRWEYLGSKTKRAGFRVLWYARRWGRHWRVKIEELTLPRAIVETRQATEQAVNRYEFVPYPGRAVLFRAIQQPPGIRPNPTLGWGPYVQGGLEIYDTPGHHGAIVREPRSRALAAQLQESLHRAHAAHPAPVAGRVP